VDGKPSNPLKNSQKRTGRVEVASKQAFFEKIVANIDFFAQVS
jgi:hypothetical protein